jgi:hypothetical protein
VIRRGLAPPHPDWRVCEQVERAPAAQRDGGDGVELLADVPMTFFIANAKNTMPTIIGKCAYTYTSRASATRSAPWRSWSIRSPRIEMKSNAAWHEPTSADNEFSDAVATARLVDLF